MAQLNRKRFNFKPYCSSHDAGFRTPLPPATAIGTTIAARNIGALAAPLWGTIADRSKAYRVISVLRMEAAGMLTRSREQAVAAS